MNLFLSIFCFCFIAPHVWHVEVPSLFLFLFIFCLFLLFLWAATTAYGGSQARGRIGAVTTVLHHSSQQCWILNPLSKARDRTHNLMDTSGVR